MVPSIVSYIQIYVVGCWFIQAYLEEAVKAISQNGSHTHEKLMNTLFAQPTEDTVDFTFDLDPS